MTFPVYPKPKSGSVILRLPDGQRERIDAWLFTENLPVTEVSRRMKQELGVPLHQSNVSRYYRRAKIQRTREKIMGASAKSSTELREVAGDDKNYYRILLNLLGQVVFENILGSRSPEDMKELRETLRVLISSKQEGHQADRVALQREKWEFDVSRACVAHLAELQAIIANNSLDEHARLQAIRKRLFGEKPPA